MIAIKTLVAASAVMSASFMTTLTAIPATPDEPASFTERFTDGQVPSAGMIRKGDKLVTLDKFCADQQWPYIAPECLVSVKGTTVRTPARTVTIERRTGEQSSALVRAPLSTVFAQR